MSESESSTTLPPTVPSTPSPDYLGVIKYVHACNPKYVPSPQLLTIPDQYQLISDGITRFVKEHGYDNNVFIGQARKTNVIVQAIDEDSTLSVYNEANAAKSDTVQQILDYRVVSVGSDVSDLKVGDHIEFFPQRAIRLGIKDDLCREEIYKSIRTLKKADFEQLVKNSPRFRYQSFYIINSVDIYFVHNQ